MTERKRGAQAVAAQLVAEGVDTVFTIPGLHNVYLCDALLDYPQLQVHSGRHEQGLAFMASGYTRASGKIAVPLTISGPGVTNALTALADAYADSVPMVLIAAHCDTRYWGKGAFHELKDQSGLLAAVTKWSACVGSVEEIPAAIRTAFVEAQSGRPGPTAVEIPMDVQMVEGEVDIFPSSLPVPQGTNDDAGLREAARRLAEARSPLLYLGMGAVLAGAGEEILRLMELTNMPAITTALAKGIVPEDHPLCLGWAGLKRPPVAPLLAEADLVMVVGCSLDEAATGLWRLALPGNLIQIDIAADVIGRNYPVAVGLQGDAKQVLAQLLAVMDAQPPAGRASPADRIAGLQQQEFAAVAETPGWQYMQAIQAVLPRDAIVTNDASTANGWALSHLQRFLPRTLNITSNLGALGYAWPAAIGAKAAFPEREVLAIAGDGGFLFSDYALATAVQSRLGAVAVVFNDNCYSSIKVQQLQLFERAVAADLQNPDFARLAAAYGATGVVARSPEQLQEALARAWGRDLPTVIEVPLASA